MIIVCVYIYIYIICIIPIMLAKQVCFLRVLTVPSRPQGANLNASRASTGLDRYCEYPPASNMVVKSSIHWHLPLGKLTVGPWKSPRNWVETHLSTRNWQGRHVNLLEGYRWPSSINWDFRIFQPPEGEKPFNPYWRDGYGHGSYGAQIYHQKGRDQCWIMRRNPGGMAPNRRAQKDQAL